MQIKKNFQFKVEFDFILILAATNFHTCHDISAMCGLAWFNDILEQWPHCPVMLLRPQISIDTNPDTIMYRTT